MATNKVSCSSGHQFEPKQTKPYPDMPPLLSAECPECETAVIVILENGIYRKPTRDEISRATKGNEK